MNGLIRKITPALCATLVSLTVIASDIPAQYPLFNVGRSAPNIMFTLDDSGSMARDYMPESIGILDANNVAICSTSSPAKSLMSQYNLTNDVTTSLCKASNFNHIYYNPSVTYTPRVNYLNASLGNGTGTCADPVLSTSAAVTKTTTDVYSCTVTTAYKAASGSCTTQTKDTQSGADSQVNVPASGCQEVTTWVDDKSSTSTVCSTDAYSYWSVPSKYQSWYTPSRTQNTSKYLYCTRPDSTTYATSNASCDTLATPIPSAGCSTYVAQVKGAATCTRTRTVVKDGVSKTTTGTTTDSCSSSTCNRGNSPQISANFSTVENTYTYTTITPGDTAATSTLSMTQAQSYKDSDGDTCQYLKYTPTSSPVSDDSNTDNYTHVMLRSTLNAYDSRQNGLSGRTDCADKINFICTYAEEKQNFLNWRTYYRTRLDVTKTMIGSAFASLDTRFRVGFARINSTNPTVVRDVLEFTKDGANSPRALFFSNLYSIQPSEINAAGHEYTTPLRRAMDAVGQYFTDSTRWDGSVCRQTYNITMTDGNWTDERASHATGNVDKTASPSITRPGQTAYVYTPAAPYQDDWSDTLADVAMYYWNHDLVAGLDNSVTASVADPAVWQHITQYTIGFGVKGRATAAQKTAGQWPNPLTDNSGNLVADEKIATDAKTDDLEHAAKNGHGDFFNASNPAEFQNALTNTLGAIDAASQTGSASMVAAASTTYTTTTKLFQAGFEPGWVGRLTAFNLAENGTATQVWNASIPTPANRHIYTHSGTEGIEFLWDNLTDSQKTALDHSTTFGAQILDYIRGDRSKESVSPYLFRNRTSVFGDIINSNVVYTGVDDYGYSALDGYSDFLTAKSSHQNAVYVGANDGMLHGFNADTGAELFAYVPSSLIGSLYQLTANNYSANHRYFVDGTPIVGDIKDGDNWKTILIGSTGAGGESIFGLDISDPENFAAANVLWELSPANAASPDDLGYSIPKPSIVRTGNATWQVLVANGYGSVNGSAQLLRLNANTGEIANTIDMAATGSNGLSSPAVVDKDNDGIADLAYAGDLKGNIWRINLADNSKFKVFQACDGTCATSNFQPITTKLEVRANPEGGLQILFGTGRYFSSDDNTLSDPPRVEAIYGIRDNNNETTLTMSSLVAQSITAEYAVGAVATRAGTNTTVKTRVISNNSVDYNSKAGWYLPLKSPGLVNGVGERVVNDVSLVDDKLVVTTLIPESGVSGNACATGGTTWVMEIDPISGGRLKYSALNTNADTSVINNNDDLSDGNGGYVVASGVSQDGSTAPAILDKTPTSQKKVFTNLSGSVSSLDEISDSAAEGRQSWRQIR